MYDPLFPHRGTSRSLETASPLSPFRSRASDVILSMELQIAPAVSAHKGNFQSADWKIVRQMLTGTASWSKSDETHLDSRKPLDVDLQSRAGSSRRQLVRTKSETDLPAVKKGHQALQSSLSSAVFRGASRPSSSPNNRRAAASSVDVFAPPLSYLDDYNRRQQVLARIKAQAFGRAHVDSRIHELESRSIRKKLEASATTRGRGRKSSPAK